MTKIFSVVIGFGLGVMGVWYNSLMRSRMEVCLPSIRDSPIFDFAAIYSLFPFVLIAISICLFCLGRRISLVLLIASIAVPFANIIFLAVVWTLFFPELDPLFRHVFAVVFVGSSPAIGILSLILLLPAFLTVNRMRHDKIPDK